MLSVSKVGPKGQVVIPKDFRDEFGILPGEQVIFEDNELGILVKKVKEESSKIFRQIAAAKPVVRDFKKWHEYEEQFEEKLRRIMK